MKKYDTKLIKRFIDERREEIKEIDLGIEEDWFWTADTIFREGELLVNLDKPTVRIAGIEGSIWATPIMRVYYNDGREEERECWYDDWVKEDPARIAEAMAFCRMTQ